MIRLSLCLIGLCFIPTTSVKTFDFADPKDVNSVAFWTQDGWEPISGVMGGVSGSLKLDLENPEESRGEIIAKVDTLRMANEGLRDATLQEWCLDAANHPTVKFEVKGVRDAKREGDVVTCTADGTFTLKGVSQEISVPVKATYMPGALRNRNGGQVEGDLVNISAQFTFSRTKHGAGPESRLNPKLISDTVHVRVAVVGIAEG